MLRIDNVGLPNLLLGKRHYIELIQNECNVENLIDAVKATEDLIPQLRICFNDKRIIKRKWIFRSNKSH